MDLRDPNGQNHWTWADGRPLDSGSELWKEGQPDNYNGNQQDCGYVDAKGLGDVGCAETLRYMCQIKRQ